MGNVADAGKGFAPEAVGCNGAQVLELMQLGRGEALTQDPKVLSLAKSVSHGSQVVEEAS